MARFGGSKGRDGGGDARADQDKKEGSKLAKDSSDALALTINYVKQETLEPVKRLGRFTAFGMAGSMLLAVGVSILLLALLRVLQTETGPHLSGHWSWVPYVGVMVVAMVLAGLSAWRIVSGPAKRRSSPKVEGSDR